MATLLVAGPVGQGLRQPAVDRRGAVVAALGQEVASGFVSRLALHGPVESAGPGERGEFVGPSGEPLLLLEALLLGFCGSPVAATSSWTTASASGL
ncbi:hypothetical protein V2J94_38125 [Streptomyces sp. DSM 41524]|uniref:Uncharacterized protein n=1 Tax=Streptomyces asiaticus subsp. ignotus TaxID=3098222 RepID=A0ABU7QAI2_9ACTN|nr:hypothetical protein [Streptomyces sp. DSM 41524]